MTHKLIFRIFIFEIKKRRMKNTNLSLHTKYWVNKILPIQYHPEESDV
jgi:hypothetical protein